MSIQTFKESMNFLNAIFGIQTIFLHNHEIMTNPNLNDSFIIFKYIKSINEQTQNDDKVEDCISNCLFYYPKSVPEETTRDTVASVHSIYTFLEMTLQEKAVEIISNNSAKFAVHTISFNEEISIVFVLRATNTSDQILKQLLDKVIQITSFLVEDLTKLDELVNFFGEYGYKLLEILLNKETFLDECFPSIPKSQWNSGALLTAHFMKSIRDQFHEISGISCFLHEKLLVSELPLSICSLFPLVPQNNSMFNVFLSPPQIQDLKDSLSCNNQVSNLTLLVFELPNIHTTFFVLANSSIQSNGAEIEKLKEQFESTGQFITENYYEEISEKITDPSNYLTFDHNLKSLEMHGPFISQSLKHEAMIGHTAFSEDKRLVEFVMSSPNETTICHRVLSFECYANMQNDEHFQFPEIYSKCAELNPDLKRYREKF